MTEPPSGTPPPRMVRVGDAEIDLEPLAARICERYRETYPDEHSRYGDAGMAWCRHDNQYLIAWAVSASTGLIDLDEHVAWLAGVLEARDFPIDRLAHDLEMAADEVDATLGPQAAAVAAGLRRSAEGVRAR